MGFAATIGGWEAEPGGQMSVGDAGTPQEGRIDGWRR